MPAVGRTGFGSENSFKRVALTRAQKNGRSESSVAESRSVCADLRDAHSNAYGICNSDRVGFAGANWHTAKTQADWVRLKPPSHPRSVEVDGCAESSGVERERPVHQPRRCWLEINLQHSGFACTVCEWKSKARCPELRCTLSDIGYYDWASGGIEQTQGHRFTQKFSNPCSQGACDAVILQERALSDRDRALSLTRHLQVLSCWRISEPGGRLAGKGACFRWSSTASYLQLTEV